MKNYDNKSMKNIKREELLFVISALIDVAKYCKLSHEKEFTLSPENLTYNMHAMVEINESTDLAKDRKMDFLDQYKALVGTCLQKRYSYDDYYQGGMSLLEKDPFLKQIRLLSSIDEIVDILKEEYDKVYIEKYNYRQEVSRSNFRILKIYTAVVTAIFLIVLGYTVYNGMYETRINKAYISAYDAYYLKDYVKVIESLEKVKNGSMSKRMKCIAATAYVKTENLTQKQKENVLNDINTVNTDKYMDYWIYLGRSQVDEAENIAKQLSDDELLLYAYMRELTLLKDNTNIDGEKKASRIDVLEKEIEKIKKVYETEETE